MIGDNKRPEQVICNECRHDRQVGERVLMGRFHWTGPVRWTVEWAKVLVVEGSTDRRGNHRHVRCAEWSDGSNTAGDHALILWGCVCADRPERPNIENKRKRAVRSDMVQGVLL